MGALSSSFLLLFWLKDTRAIAEGSLLDPQSFRSRSNAAGWLDVDVPGAADTATLCRRRFIFSGFPLKSVVKL